jgi:ubiquinone/menaquinone biosynthesis C-methylase UbiE
VSKLTDLLLCRGEHRCPRWLCFTFDNPIRRLIHDGDRMLAPWVRPGNTAVDIGAGLGVFTIPLARLVGPSGRVLAIDIQESMLAKVRARARRAGVEQIVETRLAGETSLRVTEKADFVLTFWMVHEVPDQGRLLAEVRGMLKPGGAFLLVEPLLHVTRAAFEKTLAAAAEAGLVVRGRSSIRLSQAALLELPPGPPAGVS